MKSNKPFLIWHPARWECVCFS